MEEYGPPSWHLGARAADPAGESGFEDLHAGSLETGVSGSGGGAYAPLHAPFTPPSRRWGSYRALGPLSPRSGGGSVGARFFFDPVCEEEPRHFLDACFMCKRPLARHRDIYMYKGDVPFCSEECRQEQIEIDEAREKNWSLPMKASSSRKEQQKQKGKASIQLRAAGTVVAG